MVLHSTIIPDLNPSNWTQSQDKFLQAILPIRSGKLGFGSSALANTTFYVWEESLKKIEKKKVKR